MDGQRAGAQLYNPQIGHFARSAWRSRQRDCGAGTWRARKYMYTYTCEAGSIGLGRLEAGGTSMTATMTAPPNALVVFVKVA